jgi:hypothetical protein
MENHEEFNLERIAEDLDALIRELQRKVEVIRMMIAESNRDRKTEGNA